MWKKLLKEENNPKQGVGYSQTNVTLTTDLHGERKRERDHRSIRSIKKSGPERV